MWASSLASLAWFKSRSCSLVPEREMKKEFHKNTSCFVLYGPQRSNNLPRRHVHFPLRETTAPLDVYFLPVIRITRGATHSLSRHFNPNIPSSGHSPDVRALSCEKVGVFPGCKDDGEDKQHRRGSREREWAGEGRVPGCFAWATIRQVLESLGNPFLNSFSHVVEIWAGKPVGKRKWAVCLFSPERGIYFLHRQAQSRSNQTRLETNNSKYWFYIWINIWIWLGKFSEIG